MTEGNAFALILPLKSRHYIAEQPIDTDIDILMLQDVVVKVGGVEWQDVTLTTQGVSIGIPATQARGTYNVELTALYNNIRIRAAYFECFTIVAWSYQSDVQNYIPDSPIIAEAAFIVAGNWTNAELDALTAELRQAIADAQQAQADAEAAKEHYDELAEQITDVAQETTAEAAKQAALDAKTAAQAISGYALQGSDATATNTAIMSAIGYTIQEIDGI